MSFNFINIILFLILCIKYVFTLPSWPDTLTEFYTLSSSSYTKLNSFASHIYQEERFYIAEVNENKYLQIRTSSGEVYSIESHKDLTSIKSVIKGTEKKYYVTSNTSPYLFEISLQGSTITINKISSYPSDVTAMTNNWRFEMFYFPNEKHILSLFLQGTGVYFYNYQESNWILLTNSRGATVLASNIEKQFVKDNHYFIFGRKKDTTDVYVVIRVIYPGGNHSPAYEFTAKDIYSSNTMGYVKSIDSIIIFSYEKGTNKFSYYIGGVTQEQQSIIFSGGPHTLPEFSDIKINNAGFIENTEFLYYQAEKIDGEGNISYMIGVVDLLYSYHVYNRNYNFSISDVKFFNDTYKLKSESNNYQFLSFVSGLTQYTLCPFVHSENKCQIESSSLLKVSEEKGNLFVTRDACLNKIVGRYCMKDCPIGYESKPQSCTQCKTYYLYINKTCSLTCDSPSVAKEKMCYNCQDDDKKFFKYKCVDKCEDYYAEYFPENNTCISCKDGNKFYYNQRCVDECPLGSEIIGENNICKRCKDYGLYYSNGKCVNKCSKGEIYDEETNICQMCPTESKYTEDNKCVSECSIGYGKNEEELSCLFCQNISQYYYDKKCIDKCPLHYLFDDKSICYLCSERYKDKPYVQKDTCVAECDKGYGTNETEKLCRYCKDEELYYDHSGKCNEKCEEYSFYYEESNICYYCNETELPYYEKDECVNQCSSGSEILEGNICHYCKDDRKYFNQSTGKCVDECLEYEAIDEKDNICIDCKTKDQYMYHRQCVDKCPRAAVVKTIEQHQICDLCKDHGKVYEDNICVNKCNEYHLLDEKDNYCYSCYNESKRYYYEDEKCVRQCSEGSQVDEDRHVCFNCKKKDKYYFQNKCVDECPDSTYADPEFNICYNCYCSQRGSCINKTPQCQCEYDFYTGYNCEIQNEKDKKVKIVQLINNDLILKNGRNCFKHSSNIKDEIYNVTWQLYINDSLSTKEEALITGNNDDIFCVDGDILDYNSKNEIKLTYEGLQEEKDQIKLTIQKFIDVFNDDKRFRLYVIAVSEVSGKPMESTMEITIEDKSNNSFYDQIKYMFAYQNNYDEIIPLTGYISSKVFKDITPYATNFYVYIKNNRGELIIKKGEVKMKKGECKFLDIEKDILNNQAVKGETKVFMLMHHFDYCVYEQISPELIDKICNFIKERYTLIDKQNEEQNGLNYIEPRTIFALINSFIRHKSTVNSIRTLIKINSLLNDIIMMMKKEAKTNWQSLFYIKPHLTSLFRTTDILIEKTNYVTKSTLMKTSIQTSLSNLIAYITLHTLPNEDLQLIGCNSLFQVTRFSRMNSAIAVPVTPLSDESSSSITSIIYNNYNLDFHKKDTSEFLLRISQEALDNLKNEIALKNDTSLSEISLALITIKDVKNLTSPYSTQVSLWNQGAVFEYSLIFEYEISFPPNTKLIRENTENITCVPVSNMKIEDKYCFTHFDYKRNVSKCKCNVNDIITYVDNVDLANYYKERQFPKITVNYINSLTLPIIFASLFIILIPSIILLIYDMCMDSYLIKKLKNESDVEKRNRIYKNVSHLNKTGIFAFGWYLTLYKFPYISIYYDYNYKYPKFVKYYVNTIAALIAFAISLIPFYLSKSFDKRDKFIRERDAEYSDDMIHNLPVDANDVILGIVNAFAAHFMVKLLVKMIDYIINYSSMHISYWKPIKEMFKDYIYNDVKKDVLLGEKWNNVKMRIKAYNRICASYLLKKTLNGEKQGSRLSRYLYQKMQNEIQPRESIVSLYPETSPKSDDLMKEQVIQNSIDSRKISLVSIDFDNEQPMNIDNIMSSHKRKSNELLVCTNKRFTINKNTKEIISFKSKQKFERIRNKYMFKSLLDRKNTMESEIDSISHKSVELYEIGYGENITYLAHPLNGKQKDESKEKSLILNMMIVCIILFVILMGVYCFICYTLKSVYEKYEMFIIYAWAFPALIEIFILDFIFSLFWNVIIGLIVFKLFHLKKRNRKVKFLFKAFVDKYIMYIFKIRNYVTSYSNEFNYIDVNNNNDDIVINDNNSKNEKFEL